MDCTQNSGTGYLEKRYTPNSKPYKQRLNKSVGFGKIWGLDRIWGSGVGGWDRGWGLGWGLQDGKWGLEIGCWGLGWGLGVGG